MRQTTLKPHDVVVALKAALHLERRFTFAQIGGDLGISPSEAHAAVRRLNASGLALWSRGDGLTPVRPALRELIVSGLRYVFPPTRGALMQGIPTGAGGPTLSKILLGSEEGPLVWPHVRGTVRGPSLCPLYPHAPEASQKDGLLYDALTMIDAIRAGAARERELASFELARLLT